MKAFFLSVAIILCASNSLAGEVFEAAVDIAVNADEDSITVAYLKNADNSRVSCTLGFAPKPIGREIKRGSRFEAVTPLDTQVADDASIYAFIESAFGAKVEGNPNVEDLKEVMLEEYGIPYNAYPNYKNTLVLKSEKSSSAVNLLCTSATPLSMENILTVLESVGSIKPLKDL